MTRNSQDLKLQRAARAASGARSLKDAAKRLALRCGLLQPRQRYTLQGSGSAWVLHVHATGQQWNLNLLTQDYVAA